MQFFIVFILAAVVLGAGSMLSPAWRTSQPRIALGATLCLALVVGGAVFWAEAFGWDTLVVDYLLFALLSGVVLGGTLSSAQARAEAKGETLADDDEGWPGPQDLLFFMIVGLIILVPLLSFPAPLGTQGQILGFHTLTTRFGESFTTLAPFMPQETVIVSPGFHAFSAYLSQQLDQPIPMIHMGVTAVVLFLCMWLAYDYGAELQNKRLGRAMAVAFMLCGGVFVSYLDGHFTELMALLFMMAFLLYALRTIREFSLPDMVAGGLMMGAVVYTNLSLSIIMILGFIPLTVLAWITPQSERSTSDLLKSRLSLTVGFPIVALIGISPWLMSNLSLLFPVNPSPFITDLSLLAVIILGQGIIIVPLALWGMVVGLQQKNDARMISMVMIVWLVLVLEFSLLGILRGFIPILGDLINPSNIAQHGVIVPFTVLGGVAILYLWENLIPKMTQTTLRNRAYGFIAGAGVIVLIIGLSFSAIVDIVRPVIGLPDETITADEIAAMLWLHDNTPQSATVYSADHNAWLPVYAEREAPTIRAQRYFEWDDVTTIDNADNFTPDYIILNDNASDERTEEMTVVFEQGNVTVYGIATD